MEPCPAGNPIATVPDVSGLNAPHSSSPLSALEANRRWAATLAGIGGFVDAAGFLVILGLFTAHMSGNTTGLGVALATGHWEEAARRGFVIPLFVLATVVGVMWIEGRSARTGTVEGRNRATATVLLAEVAMLLVFIASTRWVGEPISLKANPTGFFLTAAAATLAMGFQNAVLRRSQTTGVHTTFVTGMLTEMAVASAHWLLIRRTGLPAERRIAHRAAVFALSIWAWYLAGGSLGAWLVFRFGIWTVTLPVLLLLFPIVHLLRSPRRPLP